MGNDADGQMVKFGSRRSLDKCGLLTVRRGEMKSHIKAVHRDGGFNMKTWIKCKNVKKCKNAKKHKNAKKNAKKCKNAKNVNSRGKKI